MKNNVLRTISFEERTDTYLPERIATILIHSQHARLVSRDISTRIDYLAEIASLHTRGELLSQPGLGRSSVVRIEKWMEFHGKSLRRSDESLDSVICRFDFRQVAVEARAARSPLVLVISPEDRDRIVNQLDSGEQNQRSERLMSISQNS